MTPNTPLFIGFLFFDVAAIAWAACEFWSIRPGKRDKVGAPAAVEGDKGGRANDLAQIDDPPD